MYPSIRADVCASAVWVKVINSEITDNLIILESMAQVRNGLKQR